MSPSRRRRRRLRGPAEGGAEAQSKSQPAAPLLPEWRWRTMPVFIALSVGLFVGMLLGSIVVAADSLVATIVFLVLAGMMGISVSRLVLRWLMQRGIIKPQQRRRR